jgi:competence protein ComEA
MNALTAIIARVKSGDKRLKYLLAVISALIALAVGYFWPTQTEPVWITSDPTSSPTVTNSLTLNLGKVYVHIAGSVRHPGVYEIAQDTRLFEVIALAGGFAKKADQTSINLARTLSDGEQIFVRSVGEQSPAIARQDSTGGLSLNQATSQQLESLPGVGPKLAGRIIDWRTANGGFAHVADLLDVGGIGDKLYAAIKPMVTL